MTAALGCGTRKVTPEVVVQLLDHPRFQKVRPTLSTMEPMSADAVAAETSLRFGKTQQVSPLVLLGTGALYLAIFADFYLRFLS